jgi:hypothetical protein
VEYATGKETKKMTGKKNQIKYSDIALIKDAPDKTAFVQREIARVRTPSLTEAILNRKRGGQAIILALEESKNRGIANPETGKLNPKSDLVWKLKCVSHENGATAKPGDIVRMIVDKLKKYNGKRVSTTMIEDLERSGEASLVITKEFILGQDCCFECDFTEAMCLLTEFGFNPENGRMLTDKNKPVERGIVTNKRFCEITDDMQRETSNAVNTKR